MQNIRVATAVKAVKAASGGKHAAKEGKVALHYLERYIYLILFAAWLNSEAHGTATPGKTFQQWMEFANKEYGVYVLLEEMTLE